jgi:monoamine oxidase
MSHHKTTNKFYLDESGLVCTKTWRHKPVTICADVCVVGAGISGLVAARDLVKAGKSVIVLEALDRVGGRSFSIPMDNTDAIANFGATFVGPTQTAVLALMNELGIAKYDTYSTGDLLWYENGVLTPYTGLIPPVNNPAAIVELALKIIPALDQMAATVPTNAPWTAPNAVPWDSMTFQTWMNDNITFPEAKQIIALAVEAINSVEPRDMSLLYFLWYIAEAGSLEVMVANAGTGGSQDFIVDGGTQQIAIRLAEELGIGKRVFLNNPVSKITQDSTGAKVFGDKVTVRCNQVIVAIPPTLAGKIKYEPELTAHRMQLTQRMPMGSVIKTIAVYPTPFWRAQGLNGQVTSNDGPIKAMFDTSPPSGIPGVLMGFIEGDDARALDDQDPTTRKNAALASYVRYFGPQAADPIYYFDYVWDRQIYSGGCPVAVTAPGVLIEYGPAIKTPIGRIHWGGTETADRWAGYMDGAVRAGQRVAAEVLTALQM